MSQSRVRIAPSPSGNLHVGTARTALFNYLFAKKTDGKFILRIEDTDLERSHDEYVKNIYDSLKALGLSWDEGPDIGGDFGPYVQSQRLDIYKKRAEELLEKGLVYKCYCTQEELEHEKEQAMAEKRDFVYSRKCLNLSNEEKQQYIDEGREPTLRFLTTDNEIVFDDIVRNKVVFDGSLMGDFVILKSNGMPTYNFAVVIDDIDMKITHVIRGEDHISNTPKQILIYDAYGYQLPKFAHVGMILAPDKSKLSKRHGATAVSEFIEQGYLPEAFVNFLALLGWSPPDEQEVKNVCEIAELFELERISHSPAVFNKEKLDWLNGVYIRQLPIEDITERCKKYLSGYDLGKYTEQQLQTMVDAVRKNMTILADVAEAVKCFFVDEVEIEEQVKTEALTGEHIKNVMEQFLCLTDELDFDNIEDIENQFKDFRKSMKPLKPKFIMMPIRVALTGQMHGADLSVCIQLLGREVIKQRVNKVLDNL